MEAVVQNADRPIANGASFYAWRVFFLFSAVLLLGSACVKAQCPDNKETKVIKPVEGTGYYFYRFMGDSSYRYFLDGKTFSYNDRDDPGRTFVFIDDIAYESILVERADLEEYVKSSKTIDILRAQAKHHQDYFKKGDPSMVITDYGVTPRQKPDGSEDRLFYIWKKENPPGKEAATQYLCSTLIKDGVVVLSIMPLKASVSEDDVNLQLEKYILHFDLMTSDQCKQVLSMPSKP